jgi:Skp family chaperone for outer membrane proteins
MNDLISAPKPKPQSQSLAETAAIEPPFETFRPSFWKTFAAPAGALVLIAGIGWMVAARIDDAIRAPSPEQVAAQAAAVSAAEAVRVSQVQHQEIAALRGHLETLKSKLEAQAQKTHASETTIAALQKTLSEQKANAAAAESQLQARIEKVHSEAEKALDRTPVGSIAKPTPGVRPPQSNLPQQAGLPKQLTPDPVIGAYRAFVLRDVEGGRAIVEGAHGLEEVVAGDILPGGARVEKIERRGTKWLVLTDRGVIAPDGAWDD